MSENIVLSKLENLEAMNTYTGGISDRKWEEVAKLVASECHAFLVDYDCIPPLSRLPTSFLNDITKEFGLLLKKSIEKYRYEEAIKS